MGWEVAGKSKGEGTYIYLWLIQLMNGKTQHDVVKQFSSVQLLSRVLLFATA